MKCKYLLCIFENISQKLPDAAYVPSDRFMCIRSYAAYASYSSKNECRTPFLL